MIRALRDGDRAMNSPPRVLHVHSGNMMGGIETMLLALAGSTPDLIRHSFAICFQGPLEHALRSQAVSLSMLGPVRLSRPWTVVRARGALQELLEGERPDVTIFHSLWSWIALGPAIRRGVSRAALWLHAPPTGSGWLERLARGLEPELVISNSEFTRSALPLLFPKARSAVVYPAVMPEDARVPGERDRVRQRLGVPPDVTVVIQISRLEPWKGQRALLDALGELRELGSWTCWQVGTPRAPREARFLAALQSHALDLALVDRVRFETHVTNVRELLAGADIFCQPNAEPEPFGIVFVEAMYAGLPVVACASGGALEVVEPSCGILVPPGDAGALRVALERLVLNQGLRAELGNAGRHRARTLFHPDTVARRLASVLHGLGTPRAVGS